MEIHALPQPLSGSELIDLWQQQNGVWVKCSIPLTQLLTAALSDLAAILPATKPSTAGVPWNDGGAISIS